MTRPVNATSYLWVITFWRPGHWAIDEWLRNGHVSELSAQSWNVCRSSSPWLLSSSWPSLNRPYQEYGKYEYFKAINVFIFNNLWYCWMSLKRWTVNKSERNIGSGTTTSMNCANLPTHGDWPDRKGSYNPGHWLETDLELCDPMKRVVHSSRPTGVMWSSLQQRKKKSGNI